MADFLTRLAQRALGLAAVAEPKILPRFAEGEGMAHLVGEAERRTEVAVPLVDALSEASLSEASLSEASLSEASLSEASLSEVSSVERPSEVQRG